MLAVLFQSRNLAQRMLLDHSHQEHMRRTLLRLNQRTRHGRQTQRA